MESIFDWVRSLFLFRGSGYTDQEILEFSNLNGTHSNLTSVHPDIDLLVNLKKLDLSHNQLTCLPESLGNLSNLKVLDIQNNRLNDQAENVLKTLVMTNSKIVKLSTDGFDFWEELERNRRGEPAPGGITAKAPKE